MPEIFRKYFYSFLLCPLLLLVQKRHGILKMTLDNKDNKWPSTNHIIGIRILINIFSALDLPVEIFLKSGGLMLNIVENNKNSQKPSFKMI